MDRQQFEQTVAALERFAERHPRLYKARVVLLALLGYGYLALLVALLLGLFAASVLACVYLKFVALKFVALSGALLLLVLRALVVRIPAPVGFSIGPHEAPALFARIEQLRRRLRAPRFHQVLINDDFNAGVAQVPRLGPFGWPRNYLLLGLPLLKCLTVEQFDAVLAHELGHLARGHARFGNWLYRLRYTWQRLDQELARSRNVCGFLVQRFFAWYAPYFGAYSFPLARANEYEADRISAQLTSSRTAAEALTGVAVIGRYLRAQFWPAVFARASDEPQPAALPFSDLGRDVHERLAGEEAQRWLSGATGEDGDVTDTHPSLAARLRALGEAPHLAPPTPDAAADRLLGSARERLIEALDARWREGIRQEWNRRYTEVQEQRQRLQQLRHRAETTTLAIEDACQLALLEESVGAGADRALEQLRALHARAGDDPRACFALGQRLLWRGDAAGEALVVRAMQQDREAVIPGAQTLRDFHCRAGRKAEADQWHARMLAEMRVQEAAAEERRHVRVTDRFDEHGLDAATIETLRAQLSRVAGIRQAYLVRKRLRHLPERPLYLLGFTTRAWWQRYDARAATRVQHDILAHVVFGGHTLVVNLEGGHRAFARRFRRVRNARLI